jgi:DNA anti-recombination protein RmuC
VNGYWLCSFLKTCAVPCCAVTCLRLRLECERLQSELSRQRPLIKELEKSTAAARAASRQTADQAVLLDKQLRQLRQQHQEEQTALTAELNRARHAARWVWQQPLSSVLHGPRPGCCTQQGAV